ncbi:TPA: winged helix-turn-helix transcriptional regulator [Clostridioides difficile]
MPPKVEYGLTELGKEMLPIIDALPILGIIINQS